MATKKDCKKRRDIKRIAKYMVDRGTQSTMSGNFHFEFSEIEDIFHLTMDRDMVETIRDALYDYEEVQEVDTYEDFDIMFFLGYCGLDEDEYFPSFDACMEQKALANA